MNDFHLTGPERIKLEDLLEYAYDSRIIIRAYALLWLDDGESISEVATRLSVARQTVYNWCNRFQTRSTQDFIERLIDKERSGRPKTATDERVTQMIAAIIETDPRELKYRSTLWTAPLLVQYLWDEHQISVSDDSVRRIIASLELRWKRPRHSLALRLKTWRQAKGG